MLSQSFAKLTHFQKSLDTVNTQEELILPSFKEFLKQVEEPQEEEFYKPSPLKVPKSPSGIESQNFRKVKHFHPYQL